MLMSAGNSMLMFWEICSGMTTRLLNQLQLIKWWKIWKQRWKIHPSTVKLSPTGERLTRLPKLKTSLITTQLTKAYRKIRLENCFCNCVKCGKLPIILACDCWYFWYVPTTTSTRTLGQLLPEVCDTRHNLRPRSHNLSLPKITNQTDKTNFFTGMLYKNMY